MTTPLTQTQRPSLGFVIPFYNEEATLQPLHQQITLVMEEIGQQAYTICFVDDGSRDESWKRVQDLHQLDPSHTTALRFRRNFGKADALQAGFDALDADIIFTLDADLQDDPKEIPSFLAKLEEGYDMVSGWKQVRNDPIDKTLPSKVFNALARAASGVQLNDFNCGFKAYRKEVTNNIQLFGELHRFIPILANAEGFTVGEVAVEHHPREHGVSKYGSKRFLKGLLDLITVVVLTRYLRRPAHIFGGFGILSGSTGFAILAWLSFAKIALGETIGGRPLFFLGILLLLLGVQLLSIGLIAELIIRTTPTNTNRHIETQLSNR
ncbi:glycosyltransferase family 2 protein [Coraliomargarita akajimensis]|uniref:Glycosyl transferase family 2 n=1 Tax=Coraliomargarita akajimensis (strain DSM 45221 / IAM 15411 / JCM 23193 / KCTC 12865 / 04OKA010-24) TaxID=583355 RepID=D5EMS8_CORAD|nr:glycosyltransferase family 2 protein [Coraliomargarita akajimensis]ADE55318.1 glycosyl transferase family 2 [Coraliomargarita akajimensis DSM 45221]